jgi:hypothetical protein
VFAIAAAGAVISLWKPRTTNAQEPQEKPRGVSAPASRQEFARAMAKVEEGMTDKEVLALLGKPDDIRTRFDPGGLPRRTREVWGYGTDGHLTLPTLGCVHINKEGKVQLVWGNHGQPPAPGVLPEKELRALMALIDRAPSYNRHGTEFNPLAIIQIVNTLQPLGKEKALAAISEYLRVAPDFDRPGPEGVFLVLRVLFDIPDDPGYMPRMAVGAPQPPGPEDPKKMPRFPILLQDDVPLLVVYGYNLAGLAEKPEWHHVPYFRDKGRVRAKPLRPSDAPLSLFDACRKEIAGRYELRDAWTVQGLIARQLLNMVDSVYRPDKAPDNPRLNAIENEEEQWKAAVAKVAKLDIRWNAEKNRYTFKDGSHLPDPVHKLYRRQIWEPEVSIGKVELILERRDEKRVWVTLEWSGKKGEEAPRLDLSLFAVKDKASPLKRLGGSGSGHGSTGAEISSWRSFSVELAEGAEVQVRLSVNEREQLSPVYKP